MSYGKTTPLWTWPYRASIWKWLNWQQHTNQTWKPWTISAKNVSQNHSLVIFITIFMFLLVRKPWPYLDKFLLGFTAFHIILGIRFLLTLQTRGKEWTHNVFNVNYIFNSPIRNQCTYKFPREPEDWQKQHNTRKGAMSVYKRQPLIPVSQSILFSSFKSSSDGRHGRQGVDPTGAPPLSYPLPSTL